MHLKRLIGEFFSQLDKKYSLWLLMSVYESLTKGIDYNGGQLGTALDYECTFFIGQESDHWLCLSVTPSLTPVNLPLNDAN